MNQIAGLDRSPILRWSGQVRNTIPYAGDAILTCTQKLRRGDTYFKKTQSTFPTARHTTSPAVSLTLPHPAAAGNDGRLYSHCCIGLLSNSGSSTPCTTAGKRRSLPAVHYENVADSISALERVIALFIRASVTGHLPCRAPAPRPWQKWGL